MTISGQISNIVSLADNGLSILDGAIGGRTIADKTSPGNLDGGHVIDPERRDAKSVIVSKGKLEFLFSFFSAHEWDDLYLWGVWHHHIIRDIGVGA